MNRLFLTRCSSAECPISWKGSDASAGIIFTGATNTMFRALCKGPNILILTLALGFVWIWETSCKCNKLERYWRTHVQIIFQNNVDRMALLCLYTSLTCSDKCTGNFHAFFDAHGEFLSKNQSSQALYHSFSWSIDFYVNGVSEWLQWSCNLDKDKNISPVKTCIRLFQSHQLSTWIGNKEILPYQVFVCRMSHQLEEKWCICRSHFEWGHKRHV